MQWLQILARGGRYNVRRSAQHRQYHISSTASANSGRKELQSYLDGWVGLPHVSQSSPSHSNNHHDINPVVRARAAMAQGPLLLSGSSYLLPTLRLEHGEIPESLEARLEQASGSINISNQWCCPIVLDASALAPDGSPHYRPPPPGSLSEIVSILGKQGMQVIGITAGGRQLSSQLTEEAAKAGIPSVWSPRKAEADPKFDVTQVLQLVERKQQVHQSARGALEEPISRAPTEAEADKNDIPIQDKATIGTKEKDESVEPNNNAQESQEELSMQAPIEFSSTSTVYHGSVRSGQQVMSTKGQSLVILGSVNSGGEVLSDGDIFVFGKLRGRAFAGLGGSQDEGQRSEVESTTSARIVASSFDAELVAIGDTFTTIDSVETLGCELETGQAIMVALVDDETSIETTQSLKFVPVDL